MMTQQIIDFIETELSQRRVAVIGDIMLDRYIFGEVERISPEAPVPITRVKEEKATLGGAANVASNLANLSCSVFLSGVLGNDDNRELLFRLAEKEHIITDGWIVNDNGKTTTKMRVLGNRQQMLRMDFEEIVPVDRATSQKNLHWLETLCRQGLSSIVISDYGKGLCTEEHIQKVIALAQKYHIKTIVDPKGLNWEKYRGADFITPNVKELSECVGYKVNNTDKDVVEAAKLVLARYDIGHLVVTRSEKGITLINRKKEIWHNPATQQEVFDVSGAGDTVVAVLAASIGSGLDYRDMLEMANHAAGIVVAKIGTYPVHREELERVCRALQSHKSVGEEDISASGLAQIIHGWKLAGKKVVFTNGCFDILHRGHVKYLQEAAKLGDYLVIGLNSDASVARLKGSSRPIVSEKDRAFLLRALSFVDEVVIFNEDTPYELIQQLKPNILVKGGDYTVDEVVGGDFVEKVVIIPFVDGYSTTSTINKIAELAKEGKL